MLFDELKARKKNISVEVVLIAVDAPSERLARTLRKEFNKDKSLTVQIERQREKRGLFGLFGGVEYELLEDEAESDEPVSSGQRVGRCGGIALFCLVDILALIFLEPTLAAWWVSAHAPSEPKQVHVRRITSDLFETWSTAADPADASIGAHRQLGGLVVFAAGSVASLVGWAGLEASGPPPKYAADFSFHCQEPLCIEQLALDPSGLYVEPGSDGSLGEDLINLRMRLRPEGDAFTDRVKIGITCPNGAWWKAITIFAFDGAIQDQWGAYEVAAVADHQCVNGSAPFCSYSSETNSNVSWAFLEPNMLNPGLRERVRVVLSKAKAMGVHSNMYKLSDIDGADLQHEYIFEWMQDGPWPTPSPPPPLPPPPSPPPSPPSPPPPLPPPPSPPPSPPPAPPPSPPPPVPPPPSPPPLTPLQDVALHSQVTATYFSDNDALYAVDGDPRTRWESDHADEQTIEVALRTQRDGLASVHRVSIEWEAAYAVRYKIEFHRSGRWDVSSDSGCDGFSSTSSACLAPSADEKQNGRWWRHHQYYEGVPADRVRIVLLERSMPPLVWLSSWLFNTYGYSMYSLVVEASACSSTAGTPLGATGSWRRLTSLPPGDKRTYTYHKGIEASQLEEREEGWSKEATTRMEHSFQVARGLPGVPMAELLNAAGGTMEVSSTLKREQSTRFAHELQRSTWEEVEDEISAHGILWQWVITFSDACGAVVLRTDELRITDTAQHPPCCLPGYETQGTGAPLGPCIAGTPNMCSDVEPSLAVDETGGTPRQHLLRFNADLAASRRKGRLSSAHILLPALAAAVLSLASLLARSPWRRDDNGGLSML